MKARMFAGALALWALAPLASANTMPSMSFDEKAAAAEVVVLAEMGERLPVPERRPKAGDPCPGSDPDDAETACAALAPDRYAVRTIHVLKGEAPERFILAVPPIREQAPMCCVKGHRYLLFLQGGPEAFTPAESWDAVFDVEDRFRR